MNDETNPQKSDDDRQMLERIRQILAQTKVEPAKSPLIIQLFHRVFSSGEKLENADCSEGSYHEIVPRLFLGDFQLAMEPTRMKKLGFTHVLNAAEGRKFGQINTNATFYEEFGIQYMGFSILDNPMYRISQFFQPALEYLKTALDQKKSRVYVHCQQGISRSATLVIAYLLHAHPEMTLFDVFQLVSTRRRIWPNDGFCRQLIEFDREIRTNNSSISN